MSAVVVQRAKSSIADASSKPTMESEVVKAATI